MTYTAPARQASSSSEQADQEATGLQCEKVGPELLLRGQLGLLPLKNLKTHPLIYLCSLPYLLLLIYKPTCGPVGKGGGGWRGRSRRVGEGG